MKKFFTFAIMFLLLSASAVRAEPIPDYVLQKDYDSCMGGENDPQRAQYCGCVRDKMRGWDLDTYGNVAEAQAKSGSTTKPASAEIDEIAQACIAQILK